MEACTSLFFAHECAQLSLSNEACPHVGSTIHGKSCFLIKQTTNSLQPSYSSLSIELYFQASELAKLSKVAKLINHYLN